MKKNPFGLQAIDTCDAKVIHCDVVQKVTQKMPFGPDFDDLAGFFKLLGDPTRIRILWALSESEMCVCDICALLEMKQPAVSQQLRILKQARVVRFRRDGKVVYYALDDDHIRSLVQSGLAHLGEPGPAEKKTDAKR